MGVVPQGLGKGYSSEKGQFNLLHELLKITDGWDLIDHLVPWFSNCTPSLEQVWVGQWERGS